MQNIFRRIKKSKKSKRGEVPRREIITLRTHNDGTHTVRVFEWAGVRRGTFFDVRVPYVSPRSAHYNDHPSS